MADTSTSRSVWALIQRGASFLTLFLLGIVGWFVRDYAADEKAERKEMRLEVQQQSRQLAVLTVEVQHLRKDVDRAATPRPASWLDTLPPLGARVVWKP